MFKGIVKRPIAVTMVLIAVMVLGITAIKKLPVSLVPDIDIPQITVQVTSPDRSARELNDALLQPLRSELAQVPHLKDIICTAKDGNGLIEMTFEYGTDADYTFIDVNERVDLASARWDASEDRPIIARASATDIPAFFINVSLKDGVYAGGNKMLEMSDFCREVIIRRLEQLPQVAAVINGFSGATHNYEREGRYNLWFTLLSPSEQQERATLAKVRNLPGVESVLNLKAHKKYKINVQFKLQ